MQIRYSKQAKKDIKKLPDEHDKLLMNEIAKKLLLAWDPDFTKVTPEEKRRMEIAEKELENGEYYSHDDVWADIE